MEPSESSLSLDSLSKFSPRFTPYSETHRFLVRLMKPFGVGLLKRLYFKVGFCSAYLPVDRI
jgi:hypothetical protein